MNRIFTTRELLVCNIIRLLYLFIFALREPMKPFVFPALLLQMSALMASVSQAGPVEYRAEYFAETSRMPIKVAVVRELIRLDDGRYRLVSSAKAMLVKVTETSEFEIHGNDLLPVRYTYKRKGPGRNKKQSSIFDWPAARINHDNSSSALTPGTLDKLSYQYLLRMDVAEALRNGNRNRPFEYAIADGEERKRYRFRITGEETLPTPMGDFHTVRVERVREDSERKTALWFAIDHEFLLAKLRHTEDERSFELNLNAATIGGGAL